MGAATEIVVEELTKSMQKQGVPIDLIDIQTERRLPNQLPIIEVSVPKCFTRTDVQLGVMHKLKRVVYSISLASTLKKLLKRSSTKVVLHFHNQYNLFFFLKLTSHTLRKKAHILYTNHSYIWHDAWEKIETTIKKRYFQEVFCIEHADHVFVLNEQTKRNIVKHLSVSKDKVTLIDNGVNTEIYNNIDVEEKEVLKKARKLKDKKVFVQVGSVCDRKNQLASVQLLLPLMKKDESIVFCYAGGIISPEYQASIDQFAKDNGVADRVIYAGELQPGKQLNEFYNLAEAMIFPSKAEGFSLVVIEAMSAGVPVVISNTLLFNLAEKCLRFTDSQDFEHLVQDQILNKDNQQKLAVAARSAVINEYSWDKVAKDYLDTVR